MFGICQLVQPCRGIYNKIYNIFTIYIQFYLAFNPFVKAVALTLLT